MSENVVWTTKVLNFLRQGTLVVHFLNNKLHDRMKKIFRLRFISFLKGTIHTFTGSVLTSIFLQLMQCGLFKGSFHEKSRTCNLGLKYKYYAFIEKGVMKYYYSRLGMNLVRNWMFDQVKRVQSSVLNYKPSKITISLTLYYITKW